MHYQCKEDIYTMFGREKRMKEKRMREKKIRKKKMSEFLFFTSMFE